MTPSLKNTHFAIALILITTASMTSPSLASSYRDPHEISAGLSFEGTRIIYPEHGNKTGLGGLAHFQFDHFFGPGGRNRYSSKVDY